MKIGINASSLIALGRPADEMVAHAVAAEADGFASWWMAQLGVPDALTALGVVGQSTSSIELGTAVVPTWLRHPLMLANQALTTQELCGGRLCLGIGLAHRTIEDTLRIPFERPAKNMDEYLSVLLPVLEKRGVSFEGEIWSAIVPAVGGPPDVPAPSVVLAAMGPRMLAMAGGRADGTMLWLSGPKTIAERIAPAVNEAAEAAGRPAPRIIGSVPVCVTENRDAVLGTVAAVLAGYNDLPSYRGVMDVEGVDGPEGVSIVGGADEVREGLNRFAEAGATDFAALEFFTNDDEHAATRELLKTLV